MEQSLRPSRGYLAAALVVALAAICLVCFWWLDGGREQRDVPPVAGAGSASATATLESRMASTMAGSGASGAGQGGAGTQGAQGARAPEGDADPTRDLRSYVVRGEKPTMGEVITRLHERGVHTGLGAFNPPGTRPPLVGLAVAEDFALPKGYVRHHQATDDGQRIEAILMFAPDYQPLDAAGQPIPLPTDRVVPPELAPPGLPIRRITIPAPIEPATPGR